MFPSLPSTSVPDVPSLIAPSARSVSARPGPVSLTHQRARLGFQFPQLTSYVPSLLTDPVNRSSLKSAGACVPTILPSDEMEIDPQTYWAEPPGRGPLYSPANGLVVFPATAESAPSVASAPAAATAAAIVSIIVFLIVVFPSTSVPSDRPAAGGPVGAAVAARRPRRHESSRGAASTRSDPPTTPSC